MNRMQDYFSLPSTHCVILQNIVADQIPIMREEHAIFIIMISEKISVIDDKTHTYHMNSRQCEQNVGCLRKVAMNLCPLT